MNLLKKLLLIVVVGVLIRNEYGAAAPMPILDLPDETPGLQYDEQIKRVTGVDTLCVHVIVPNMPAANVNDLADQLVAPGNIYFPVNGVQPTTPEAVEYSCANVDNREDSPITEWYMQMFGVIPVNRANVDVAHVEQNVPYPIYVQAGWINNANSGTQRIISFDATVNEIQENDPSMPGMKISRQDLFKREFRKIASTSVGRTLLYRILIEVRRHLPDGSGCFETENINRLNECYASDRNRLRHIRITFDELEEMGFFSGDGKINIKNAPILPYEISETQFKDNSFKIEKAINSYLDVNIFHEFVHYFHSLRHFMRREVEKFYVWVTILPNEFECSFRNALLRHSLGRFLWRKAFEDDEAKSIEQAIDINYYTWKSELEMNNEESAVFKYFSYVYKSTDSIQKLVDRCKITCSDFEELRTIVGSHSTDVAKFLNGDDLCENLYRVNQGLLLRWGHVGPGKLMDHYHKESVKVVQKIIDVINSVYNIYKIPAYSHYKRMIRENNNIEFGNKGYCGSEYLNK